MARFDNKVVIVTGGSAGIGKAAAIEFAREGASVVIGSRRVEEGEAAAEEIRAEGGEALFVQTDVAKREDCFNLVERTIEKYGKLDVAYNNAGKDQNGTSILDLEEEEFDQVWEVNVKSVFYCLKAQIPAMKSGGSIINCSSIATMVAKPGMAGYATAKFGVIGLTRTAAVECGPKNIRVNVILPGGARTEMFERFLRLPGIEEALLRNIPLGRFAHPSETAKAVLFLASDDASFVNGLVMPVDGGATLG